ncbi:MAG: hypothetical protein V7709_12390 [Halioglobus sp.]
MKKGNIRALTGLALLLPALSLTQNQMTETDWLEMVEGYTGSAVGAQMRKIEKDEATGGQKLTISIPKIAISHPDAMEEVIVVGQAPEERGPLFDFKYEYEWLDDYDNDNYGLVIRVGKETNWPIRLFMHSDDGPRTTRDITRP